MPPAGHFLSAATESAQRTPPKPMVLDSLRGHGAECIETFHPANKTTQTRPVLSHCLRRYPPRRAPRLCCPSKQGKSLRLQPGAMWGANRAPPVAEEASRFRGSAPIGRHDSGRQSAGTTVLPRRLSRIFRDRERVRRFCRSSSYTSCRCRRGRGHCGRSSAPGGAAFSRCRRRRRSRRWPWPPAHA